MVLKLTKNLLDFGCGSGEFCNFLSKRYPNCQIYGLDISEKNIKACKMGKFAQNEQFIQVKKNIIPFKDNFFDKVYCWEVLEHVENFESMWCELIRVLRVGGTFEISVPLPESEKILLRLNPEYFNQIGHKRMVDKKKLLKIAENNGLRLLKYSTYNSMEHLFWVHLFKKKAKIINQLGETDKRADRRIRVANFALSKDICRLLDQTKRKDYRFFIKILMILYPLGRIMDLFLTNKRQKFCFKKIKN